jgi:hypothetical protein
VLKLHPLQATLQSLRFRLAIIASDVALLYVPLYGKPQARLPLYMLSATGKLMVSTPAITSLNMVGSSITPLVFAWMNDICIGNSEQRSFIVAGANTMKYIVGEPQSPITDL